MGSGFKSAICQEPIYLLCCEKGICELPVATLFTGMAAMGTECITKSNMARLVVEYACIQQVFSHTTPIIVTKQECPVTYRHVRMQYPCCIQRRPHPLECQLSKGSLSATWQKLEQVEHACMLTSTHISYKIRTYIQSPITYCHLKMLQLCST